MHSESNRIAGSGYRTVPTSSLPQDDGIPGRASVVLAATASQGESVLDSQRGHRETNLGILINYFVHPIIYI